MTAYLLVTLFLALPALLNPKSKILAFIALTLLCALSSFRENVGFDYDAYYNWARYGIDDFSNQFIEPSSKLILIVAYKLDEPQIFFIISSIMISGFYGLALIRTSRYPVFAIFSFYCLPLLFLFSLSVVRQFMAGSLMFYAITVYRKRAIFAIIFLLLAGSFHYSAWLAGMSFIFLGQLNRKYSALILMALLSLAPFIFQFILEPIFSNQPYFDRYLSEDLRSGLKLFGFYYCLAAFLILLREWGIVFDHLYFNMFLIGVFILGMLSPINEIVARGAIYFLVFGALLIPEALSQINPKIVSRYLAIICLICLLLYQFYLGIKNPKDDPYIPYKISLPYIE